MGLKPGDLVAIRSPALAKQFSRHFNKWSKCRACPLHKFAHLHVIGTGKFPCDVVFVGEAPGETEDVIGKPFKGRAGRMLQTILDDVFSRLPKDVSYSITNAVACKPFPKGGEICPPTYEEVEACQPRLVEFLEMAKPKLIVALGKAALVALIFSPKEKFTTPILATRHPSYINRCGGSSSLEYKKMVLELARVFKATFFA